MDQVSFVVRLDNGTITLPQDIKDDFQRANFDTIRESARNLLGSLECPQKEQLCSIAIIVDSTFGIKTENPCHGVFVDLVRETIDKQPLPKKFHLVP